MIITYNDPVTTLLAYINDIKPYHTKIVETAVELIYGETFNVTIKDAHNIDALFDINYGNPCISGYDTGDYDDHNNFGGPSYRYSVDGTDSTAWCGNEIGSSKWAEYVSPTTVVPSFLESIKFWNIVKFYDVIRTDVIDYTNVSVKIEQHNHIKATWNDVHNIATLFDINYEKDPRLAGYDTNIFDDFNNFGGPDFRYSEVDSNKPSIAVSSSFIDNITVLEVIRLYDIVGVTICDPKYGGSSWEMDWGMDSFWESNFPNQTGWDSYPGWDDNKGVWYGGDADTYSDDPIYICIPGSLVGGWDDSYGLDGLSSSNYIDPGFDSDSLWNSLNDNNKTASSLLSGGWDDIYGMDGLDGFGSSCHPDPGFDSSNLQDIEGDCDTECNSIVSTTQVITVNTLSVQNLDLTFPQTVARSVWNIIHLLHRYPIVRIFNEQHQEIQPAHIKHTSEDSVVVTFDKPTTGIIRFL